MKKTVPVENCKCDHSNNQNTHLLNYETLYNKVDLMYIWVIVNISQQT